MANEGNQMPQVDMLEQIALRDRQLKQLQTAYLQLQQNNISGHIDRTMKNIRHLPTFTNTGDITINSFFISVEHLLENIV